MADHGKLFSAPMVRALLAGTKTQTRRVIPEATQDAYHEYDEWCRNVSAGVPTSRQWEPEFYLERSRIRVGDRLWCREAWRVSGKWDATTPRDLPARTMTTFFEAGGSMGGTEPMPKDRARTAAEYVPDVAYPSRIIPDWAGRLRPGIHMPRWMSRLTLIVTDVRVQRLQDISEEDARAEGVTTFCAISDERQGRPSWDGLSEADQHAMVRAVMGSGRRAYEWLWESINGPGSWDENPWIAACSFTVHQQNIDALEERKALAEGEVR